MIKQQVILLIEDNELNLDMAKSLLQNAGFHTLEAEDAANGIRIARECQPDLILMDIHLPIMNGYEACRIIKSEPLIASIPIVAFTAHAMEEEAQKALDYGCSGIISKPIDVDQFPKQIAGFLNTAKQIRKNRIPA
jgi:CheY-like chemotaxis protein